MAEDPRLIGDQTSLRGVLRGYRRRIGQGDVGQLPVVVGLILIWGFFFWASHGNFFNPLNIVNLSLQMAAVGTIAIGVVFVLLLGEIDLTVGVVSGLCAAVVAVLNVKMGIPGPLAVLAGLLVGLVIGLLQGAWITRFGIPSFVVTLAGLIGWQGALLVILGSTGTINLRDPFVVGLAGTFFKGIVAWGLAGLFVAYIAASSLLSRRGRVAAELSVEPLSLIAVRVGVIAVFLAVALSVLERDRGLPLSVASLFALVVLMDYVAKRTRFGRMVFAVGGNAEAARRAGFPVQRVRVAVFVLASLFASWGGILASSRLQAVNQSAGSGDVLLNAIAAAVIGGTSLFGGRGAVWSALIGILVIQSISNGMDLLAFDPAVKQVITGIVLLTAVTIDAVARRGRQVTARTSRGRLRTLIDRLIAAIRSRTGRSA